MKFLSRGGKPQLEALARTIVRDNVSNIIVAMDADYARFFANALIGHPRVLYTFGYCWGNDVFSPDNTLDAFCELSRRADVPPAAIQFHSDAWESVNADLARGMRADFFAFRSGSSVIDAQKPGRYVGKLVDDRPTVKKGEVLTAIMAANTATKPRTPRNCIDVPRDPFRYVKGRLIAFVSRQLCVASMRAFGNLKAATDAHHKQTCLSTFEARLRNADDDHISKHHRDQCERLLASV